MSISYIYGGSIFFSTSEAIVNPVNCEGVCGKGLAFSFKQKYPHNYEAYKEYCTTGNLFIGSVFTTKRHSYPHRAGQPPKYVINFPTKREWRNSSKLSYIQRGMTALLNELDFYNISSVAIPALGCGLGGLDWNEVYPILEDGFATVPDLNVTIYAPTY